MTIRYYDTNVFLHAQNPEFPATLDCQRIICGATISWIIAIDPELIAADSNFGVAQYAQSALALAVSTSQFAFIAVDSRDRIVVERANKKLKKTLKDMSMAALDVRHVMSVIASQSNMVVTSDSDFWDPVRKAGGTGSRIEQELLKIGVTPVLPVDCI